MWKKIILPAAFASFFLVGCSSADVGTLEKDVETLKQEVAALKAQLGVSDSGQSSGESATADTSNGPATYAVGETFQYEGVTYTITKGERIQQISDSIKPRDGKDFILIHFEIHNTSNNDYKYSQNDYSVVTDSGDIIDNYLVLDVNNNYDDLGNGELAPNGKRTGWVAFDIPVEEDIVELRYQKLFSKEVGFKVSM